MTTRLSAVWRNFRCQVPLYFLFIKTSRNESGLVIATKLLSTLNSAELLNRKWSPNSYSNRKKHPRDCFECYEILSKTLFIISTETLLHWKICRSRWSGSDHLLWCWDFKFESCLNWNIWKPSQKPVEPGRSLETKQQLWLVNASVGARLTKEFMCVEIGEHFLFKKLAKRWRERRTLRYKCRLYQWDR